MIDQLRVLDSGYLARLLTVSKSWPDRGRALRQRLTRQVVCDWAARVAGLPEDPLARGGSDARAPNRKGTAPMKIGTLYPSKYLKADDIEDELILTIKSMEMSDGLEVEKPILYFEEGEKGLILNKTNAMAISSAFGSETDLWIGKKIVLYTAQVQFQARIVDAIRVRVPKTKTAAKKAAAGSAAPLGTVLQDDIPFAAEWR
jgi:hypothetical protein